MKHIAVTGLAFLLLFIAWRHFRPGGILFYQGLVLAAVVTVAQFTLTRLRGGLSWRLALKDALLSFLLIYSFVFTIPTTVDRAYSVRMLLRLETSPDGLTRDQIERWFRDEFVAEGGVERRLIEQQATGSVAENQGRYRLTPAGKWLTAAFRFTQAVFACGPADR